MQTESTTGKKKNKNHLLSRNVVWWVGEREKKKQNGMVFDGTVRNDSEHRKEFRSPPDQVLRDRYRDVAPACSVARSAICRFQIDNSTAVWCRLCVSRNSIVHTGTKVGEVGHLNDRSRSVKWFRLFFLFGLFESFRSNNPNKHQSPDTDYRTINYNILFVCYPRL